MSSDDRTRHTLADETTKPVIHVDIITAIRGVTNDLLPKVLREVQASNRLATRNQLVLRILGIFLALVLILVAACVFALWQLSMQFRVAHMELDIATDQLEELRQSQHRTTAAVEDVKEQAETIQQEQAAQPRVEIVEEKDPVKARRAPLKVRVTQPQRSPLPAPPPSPLTPPAPPPASSPAVVLEAPILVKDAEVVPTTGSGAAEPQEKR